MYSEVQSFRQHKWLLVIMSVFSIGSMIVMFLGLDRSSSDGPSSEGVAVAIIIFVSAFVLVFALLLSMSLELRIESRILQYRYKPLAPHWKTILPEDIKRWEVRKYRAVQESGGWGMRYSPFKKTTAYTVRGRNVLEIEKVSGGKILIGTQNPEELRIAMERMMERKDG